MLVRTAMWCPELEAYAGCYPSSTNKHKTQWSHEGHKRQRETLRVGINIVKAAMTETPKLWEER